MARLSHYDTMRTKQSLYPHEVGDNDARETEPEPKIAYFVSSHDH